MNRRNRRLACRRRMAAAAALLCAVCLCPAGRIWPEYSAALGTLPQAQGWTAFDANEPGQPSIADGVLHQGPTGKPGVQGWQDRSHAFCFDGEAFVVTFEIKVIESDYAAAEGRWRTGWGVRLYDHAGRFVYVGIASNGIRMTTSPRGAEQSSTAMFLYDVRSNYTRFSLYVYNGLARLAIDGREMSELTLPLAKGGAGERDLLSLGDHSRAASSEVLIKSFDYYAGRNTRWPQPGFAIGLADLEPMVFEWPEWSCTCPDLCGNADINRDGRIDLIDMSMLCELWL